MQESKGLSFHVSSFVLCPVCVYIVVGNYGYCTKTDFAEQLEQVVDALKFSSPSNLLALFLCKSMVVPVMLTTGMYISSVFCVLKMICE